MIILVTIKFSCSKFYWHKLDLHQLESWIHVNGYVWHLQAVMASLNLSSWDSFRSDCHLVWANHTFYSVFKNYICNILKFIYLRSLYIYNTYMVLRITGVRHTMLSMNFWQKKALGISHQKLLASKNDEFLLVCFLCICHETLSKFEW